MSIFDNTFCDDIEVYKNTYCIHLWNEIGRRIKEFDKNATFDEGSLFEQLKKTRHTFVAECAEKSVATKYRFPA